MNAEQIIKLAHESGATPMRDNDSMGIGFEFEMGELVKFVTLVAQAEREECAKVIRERNHIVDASKMVPGLAIDSGEFIPAEKMTDWSAA